MYELISLHERRIRVLLAYSAQFYDRICRSTSDPCLYFVQRYLDNKSNFKENALEINL